MSSSYHTLATITTLLLTTTAARLSYNIEIDVQRDDGDLPQFWKSTGFSPPDPKSDVYKFLLSDDERVNIALIGALPHNGIQHVRVHWLINLIRLENGGYNFDYLDAFLDWLHLNRLKPGFELMGTPIGVKGIDPAEIYPFWYGLTRQISSRYVGRYGLKEVQKWRFETWNEPDLKMYNTNNFTLKEFITYASACGAGLARGASDASHKSFTDRSGGVTDTGPTLKIGGPAGLFKHPTAKHPLCWGLLAACNRTPEACPLQYISFHKKGDGTSVAVLLESVQLLEEMHRTFPNLKRMPIANDEADILKTWSKPEEWRADVRYAAMVADVVIDHFKEIIHKRKVKMEVLSNDNGFLNYHPFYFTQRTLLARYIKAESRPVIKALASRDDPTGRVAVVLTYAGVAGGTARVNLTLKNLPGAEWKYAVYLLDNSRTNPSGVWTTAGRPVYPGEELFGRMRSAQEPYRLHGPSRANIPDDKKHVLLTFSLQPPSVALVNVCSPTPARLGPPTRLRALRITLHQILLIWKDNKLNTKCVRTFVVEYKEEGVRGLFRRINAEDTVFLSYQHVATGNSTCRGHYRVRAVDYFDRVGPPSKVINYRHP